MPKLNLLTVAKQSGAGLDAGSGYVGMAVLLEDDPAIPIKAPALLLYNGSPNGDIYPGLVAAINDDGANFLSLQSSRLLTSEKSLSASPLNLYSKALLDNSAYRILVSIVGRRADSPARAKFVREALIYREGGGSATIQGSVQLPVADIKSDASWTATVSVSGNNMNVVVTGVDPTAASLIVQDLTYTAAVPGTGGNAITIAYITGGTAGSEVVSVVGTAIQVQIQSGVSTATQVKAAVDAFAASHALVSVAISGTGSNAQTAPTGPTPLAGGVSPEIDWTARVEIEKAP